MSLSIIVTSLSGAEPQTDFGIIQQSEATMQWFRDAKYGMFIHWGIYAVPAKGEWHMEKSAIPIQDYRTNAYDQGNGVYFDAKDYDPRAWMEFAKKAGMKYACLTARHHDGYALFESKHTNAFTSVQSLSRDLFREYVDACRAAGLKVGVYYSPLSFRYPGYFDVTGTNCKTNNAWGYTTAAWHKENARLMKEEVYEQVRTLFRDYGPFDYLYWDGAWLALRPTDRAAAFFWEPGKYRSATNDWPVPEVYSDFDETGQPLGLMGIVRKYSPNVICNNRSGWIGDIEVREGTRMDLGPITKGRPWERNMNFNEAAWGFATEQKCLTYEQLVEHLIHCVVRDGNLLLNFGPDRHGVIPAEHFKVALRMGEWLEKVGEAVYGTRAGPWEPVDRQYGFTQKPGRIFIHLLAGYSGDTFTTPPLPGRRIVRSMDLFQGRDLKFEQRADGSVAISGIDRTKHPACTVVALRLSE